MSVNNIIPLLTQNGISVEGLSEGAVSQINAQYDSALPEEYVQFLKNLGRGAGKFMRGNSVFYPELLSLQEWGEELLSEHNLALPENAYVFWMHQGYQLAYFSITKHTSDVSHNSDPKTVLIFLKVLYTRASQ